MASLKPFVLNLADLDFLLDQVTFLPLFDQGGNAIVAWDGTGAIYDGRHNLIWNGIGLTSEVAIQTYGQSFASTTDLSGIRDVSGLNNNLLLVNAGWGSVDQPFVRTVKANFADYVKPLVDSNGAANDPNVYYGEKTFDLSTAPGIQYTPSYNYTTTVASNGTVMQSSVVDYTPRMISRTITTGDVTFAVDGNGHIAHDAQGVASITSYGLLEELGHKDYQNASNNEFFIGAENPGVAPTNGWFALFGQFFDHGLDKLGSGGQNTTIKIALATDDPLYGVIGSDGRPATAITISRATVSGVDANGDPAYINHTSPFIDQSQTYGSQEQITQLLRKWVSSDGGTTFHAGMELYDGTTLATQWARPNGALTNDTLPTLNELRDHVLDTARDALTWEDVTNFRNRNASGDVATGAGAGLSGQALLLDMNPRFDNAHLDALTVVGTSTVNALVDAAVATLANATPGLAFSHPISGGIQLVVTGGAGGPFLPDGTYTGASALAPWVNFADFSITAPAGPIHDAVGQILLAAVGDHYVAGDGRVNENVGLTAIHHVFHEEHNFQIQNVINTINAQDAAVSPTTHEELHRWQVTTGTTLADDGNYKYADGSIAWDQDKMFNAAKLIVEMEYQHAAVDQYARSITPHILEVVGYSSGVDSTISLEYSQSAFRFGHSTIRETIDTIDPTHGLTGQIMSFALEQAFLNPALYAQQGAAAIALGMSHQQMNEVDEFITPALNQGLLGLPLDLAAINIARGRDFGIPNLNEFREAVGLTAYASWDDFGHNMIHPESLVNFIAAYAFDGDVAKAQAIIGLFDGSILDGDPAAMGYTADQALAFMYNADGALGGAAAFNLIDTWIGGLAEAHVPGGLLGSTFDLVFTNQIENLINGDRFYYLVRLFGQQFGEEVNNGQFKDIVERNTGLTHLNGSIFAYADQYYDFTTDPNAAPAGSHNTDHMYGDVLAASPTLGVWSDGSANPASINGNGAIITFGGTQYIRDFRPDLAPDDLHPVEGTPTSGADSHEVMVGTGNADFLHMRSGDDTAYGEGGDDKLFGDFGNDRLYGGDGADVIDSGDGADLVDGGAGDDVIYGYGSGTEIGGFDQLIGGDGNDIIYGGEGVDKLSGGAGDDALYGEGNTDPFTHGGDGNDYIDGGSSGDNLYGDAGDDFIVGGDDQDIVQGDDGDDILRPGRPSQAINGGPDEVIGGTGYADTGFDLMDLSDYDKSPTGVTADMTTQQNPLTAIDGTTPFPAWFQMEGVVGTQNNDTIIGDDPVVDPAAPINNVYGHNWLIGGSGSDTFTGAGGNDVIVGGSIRLDTLIGKYNSGYTHNNNNVGVTSADQLQNVLYEGASHRVLYSETIDNTGLIDAVNATIPGTANDFAKHFTELLRTEKFKDTVLGDGGTDASTAANADIAVFTGRYSDYTITAVPFNSGNADGSLVAYKIVDLRDPLAVDANGVLIPTDGTDLVVGVEKLQFSDRTISLLNTPPVLDLHAYTNSGTVADDFDQGGNNNSNRYDGNTGSNNWIGNWSEQNDGNGNASTGGQIFANGNQLEFGPGDGATIQRLVNLGTANHATLSFTAIQAGLNNGEKVDVYFSSNANAANSFTLLGTLDNSLSTPSQSFDLTQYLAAGQMPNAAIRFVVSNVVNDVNVTDRLLIDDLVVSYQTALNDNSNNYTTAFTENGSRTAISAGPSITDDGTTIASAKATMTIVTAGDTLRIGNSNNTNGNLSGGISYSIATAGNVVTLSMTGVATLAQYQAAIEQIRFFSSSDTPTNQDRIVNVTVNDGLVDSNLATTTIHVTPVNDAPNAGAENVVSNFASGSQYTIPSWALLANDTDIDGPGPLSVSAVTDNLQNFTAGLSAGNITVTDSSNNNRSFTYTVSDAAIPAGTDQQQVGVSRDTTGNVDGNDSNTRDILIGDGNNSTFDGGTGDDIILAGAGNDTIVWNANNGGTNTATDGRDFVDGGTTSLVSGRDTGSDSFVVNGRSNVTETFSIYSNTDDWDGAGPGTGSSAAHAGFTGLNANTEIVITRTVGSVTTVVAELDNIEEITINALTTTVNNGNNPNAPDGGTSNGDTIQVIGNFTGTSLNYSTIHINGGGGADTVDISGLTSDHRVVFHGGGGDDHVVGTLRPQDVVDIQNVLPSGDQGGTTGGDDQHCSSGDHDHHDGQDGGGTPIQPGDIPGLPAPRIGTAGDDVMVGAVGDDVLSGLDGDDVILGNDGADTLKAGAGDDLVKAGAGDDVVFGNEGNDDLFGGAGRDLMTGDAGDDRLFGDAGDDALEGGTGNDTVYGGAGSDRVIATVGDGDDTYFGDTEEDTLDYSAIAANITADLGNGIGQHGSVTSAQSGNDKVFGFEDFIGGSGNDTIVASSVANVMDGGGGNDTFVFGSSGDANGDTIKGFQPGDKIDLSAIDANMGASGTQAFVLFAGNVFTSAGQVIVTHEVRDGADHTIVSGNTNGDAVADFKVDIAGNHALASSDFNGVH